MVDEGLIINHFYSYVKAAIVLKFGKSIFSLDGCESRTFKVMFSHVLVAR
jgi:hypothetical protein